MRKVELRKDRKLIKIVIAAEKLTNLQNGWKRQNYIKKYLYLLLYRHVFTTWNCNEDVRGG